MEPFDVIIVGAGSAGCALAEGLTASGRLRVLLLEAGGAARGLSVRVPIGYGRSFHDPAVNWRFTAEPDPGLGGRAAYWPRGKGLGGSSAINAMVWMRGLPEDYEDWREAGNPGWGWNEVGPLFDRIERRIGADGAERGEGAVAVSDREPEFHPIRRHFYAAAREAGLPLTRDFNGPAPEGVGPYAHTIRRGLRCSAADAYLAPAMARRNLTVATGAHAERILFEGRRAVGVAWRRGGALFSARAREVVLAAGAIGSPQLLQLSGVGPVGLLCEMGVPVVHHSPGVGAGLRDHVGLDYAYRAKEATLNQALGPWRGRIACALSYALRRAGPLSLSVNQIGGLVRSAPERNRPDLQLYFNPVTYTVRDKGRRKLLNPDAHPGFILGFNACRPTSEGSVTLRSPDPAAPPRIIPNALATEADRADAVAGARLIGRLQNTAALRALIDGAPAVDLAAAEDEAILADFRVRGGSVFHACRTCRMGPEERGGVVDHRLRVHGVGGLRVADASVFPDIPSANTNAPAIMVGRRAAEIMLADQA